MNNKERLEVLEQIRYAFQRFRSVVLENAEKNGTENHLPKLFPWVFGDKCLLPSIQKCLDQEYVSGQELYNFLYVLHNFSPEVMVSNLDYDFPEPEIQMMMWI